MQQNLNWKTAHPQTLLQLFRPGLCNALQLSFFGVRSRQQRGLLGSGADGSLGPIGLRLLLGTLQNIEERKEGPTAVC
jgi:hypothetical protein